MKSFTIILFLLFWSGLGFGQSLFESATQRAGNDGNSGFNLNGYVRGSAYGAGENADFTQLFGEVSLQAKLQKDQFLMNSDLRFRSGYQFNHPVTEFEIKEAYAGISTSFIDVLLGEKIESWGRTDGFNPTNNITPNNYFFFSANPDDQKIPNFMLKTAIRFTPQIDWEIIALPIFRPSNYRYDLFNMGDNVSFVGAVLPERTFENASLATKFNFEFSGIGFSASWFHGYDPFYGFDLQNVDFSTGAPVITYIPSFYQKNTFGLDFALPVGTWILRGEGAYNLTDNPDGKIYIPNDDISYVLGLEHSFGGFTTILQYIGKSTMDYTELTEPVLTDPTNVMAQLQYGNDMIAYESASFNRKIFHQEEAMNNAMSLTITKSFAYDAVSAQVTGYYNFTSEEYMIRPNVSWKIGGALTATAGYSMMKGPDNSLFNYAGPLMNGAFLELKANF